jgi:hypothetical protein
MRKGESRMKGDERILGKGDFVGTVLKATKNGKVKARSVLCYWGTWELGMSAVGISKKTEHRVLGGKRIRDVGPENRRRARDEAFGGGH